ncbi:MAG: hypothetical protein IBV52_05580 [Candidatus Bathyarchaeota archaeon]
MSEEKVEFKILDVKLVGSNTVVFRLEDGAMVKVKVDIERAAVAIDYKNPDGTPHYNIGTGLRLTIIPKDKKFYIPKSKLKRGHSKERTLKPI